MDGRDIVLYVDVDPYAATPTGTPDFQKVASQRGFTMEETTDTFETTSKDSGKSRTYKPSFNSGTINLSGLYVPTDIGLKALKNAQRNQDMIKAQVFEEGTAVEQANAYVTTRSIEGPHDDSGTYSATIQITGDWQTVSA